MAGEGTTNINAGAIKNSHLNAAAGISKSKLAERALVSFPQPLASLRTWDSLDVPLPGAGGGNAGSTKQATAAPSYRWTPNDADDTFFVALRKYRVVGIRARVEVAGTDGGAVSAVVKKVASGTDIASGTALHTSSIDLKGTVDTNQALTLSATSAALDIAIGDAIGIDFTGTLTSARGCVSVLLAPENEADDLLLVTGTFGTGPPQVQTGDLKAAGATTRRCRLIVTLPDSYPDAEDVQIRCVAGMKTTVADVSATVDVEAYLINDDGTLNGSPTDLCATAAQSINSLTYAAKDFTLDASNLAAGSRLDVRVSIAVNDAAAVTAVIGVLHSLELRCDSQP